MISESPHPVTLDKFHQFPSQIRSGAWWFNFKTVTDFVIKHFPKVPASQQCNLPRRIEGWRYVTRTPPPRSKCPTEAKCLRVLHCGSEFIFNLVFNGVPNLSMGQTYSLVLTCSKWFPTRIEKDPSDGPGREAAWPAAEGGAFWISKLEVRQVEKSDENPGFC